MKVRVSYQHVTGQSRYDREFEGTGGTFSEARDAAVASAKSKLPGLRIPERLFWENRVPQGDGMVVVLYDF